MWRRGGSGGKSPYIYAKFLHDGFPLFSGISITLIEPHAVALVIVTIVYIPRYLAWCQLERLGGVNRNHFTPRQGRFPRLGRFITSVVLEPPEKGRVESMMGAQPCPVEDGDQQVRKPTRTMACSH